MVAELDEKLARRAMKNVTAQAEMASLRITEAAPGRIAFAIDAPNTVANYHGSVHGGFLATLLEVAAGMVATTLDLNNVALTSAVNFIKRAPVGPLIVRARCPMRVAAPSWPVAGWRHPTASCSPRPRSRCSCCRPRSRRRDALRSGSDVGADGLQPGAPPIAGSWEARSGRRQLRRGGAESGERESGSGEREARSGRREARGERRESGGEKREAPAAG